MERPPFGYGKESHFLQYGPLYGVIHVGVNDGTELGWYLQEHRLPILGFEPLPDVYQKTCEVFAPEIEDGRIRLENAALGSRTGQIVLRVNRLDGGEWDTQGASSLLPSKDAYAEQGWQLPYESRLIKVPIWRFDDWAHEKNVHTHAYNVLVIDVQGMELEVLKGFGQLLDFIPYLVIECSDPPIYKGEATAQEVEAYLANRGFRRDSPILSHNDVMFLKEVR